MDGSSGIDHLIINSPFEEPKEHWYYERERRQFVRKPGRRKAGYIIATPGAESHFDDPGLFVEIKLANAIRPRVKAWREAGYPGATGVTKELLEHWYNREARGYPFFFCQLEAVETLIWTLEAPPSERQGIAIPNDGGPFPRLCSKMATGTGKTIVMAMVAAWQILNKVAYPQDRRFSKNILVIAPGLTVRSRLSVLKPEADNSYYKEFEVVPSRKKDALRQGKVMIRNWHVLQWDTDEQIAKKKTVDKRGALSDEAYTREVLEEMASASNLVVFNDEAHHAWRVPTEAKVPGISKEELEEATKWIGGLDRIHRTRGILTCFDFSATPFVPTGKKNIQESLFDWIVSDFGLNDAIESGLVKTPRVVVRTDSLAGEEYRPRLYHIYEDPEVKDDINRRADENAALPQLVMNAYYLLGRDWLEAKKNWAEAGQKTPPVMITVANRTETAARIKYAFDKKNIMIPELCDPGRTLHIDSRVLDKAEAREEAVDFSAGETAEGEEPDDNGEEAAEAKPKLTKDKQAELLRQQVDTVGKPGMPGEQVQNVISVGMLSEGWDARTVTHIMGLRAFSSQLLCEQVVGRGLRRVSYEISSKTGLFEPEYVNIFGVPFSFLPHEGEDGTVPLPPEPKTRIEPDPAKKQFEISWPNVLRVDHVYRPRLSLDLAKVEPLDIDAVNTTTLAEMAPVVDGKPHWDRITEIDLKDLVDKFRYQRIVFEVAKRIFDADRRPEWVGGREFLIGQIIRVVEEFIHSNKLMLQPPFFNRQERLRRLLLALNMEKLVQHIWKQIHFQNTQALEPHFDKEQPIRSTEDMQPWATGKPSAKTKRSHVNECVLDSHWEDDAGYTLDRSDPVDAWVKNDKHLGFEVYYVYQGVTRKYLPDFLVKLKNGTMLIIEVKGQENEQTKAKHEAMGEWITAINGHGGFGKWAFAVSRRPGEVRGIVDETVLVIPSTKARATDD